MDTPVTKKMYGWSKYGGVRRGAVMEELDEWYCQLCGEKQTKELPFYLVPLDNLKREYVRVCSKCRRASQERMLEKFDELVTVRSEVRSVSIVANLLSYPLKI